MISKSDARLDIRLPSDLRRDLELEAERVSRTKANIVIIALRAYFNKKEQAE